MAVPAATVLPWSHHLSGHSGHKHLRKPCPSEPIHSPQAGLCERVLVGCLGLPVSQPPSNPAHFPSSPPCPIPHTHTQVGLRELVVVDCPGLSSKAGLAALRAMRPAAPAAAPAGVKGAGAGGHALGGISGTIGGGALRISLCEHQYSVSGSGVGEGLGEGRAARSDYRELRRGRKREGGGQGDGGGQGRNGEGWHAVG